MLFEIKSAGRNIRIRKYQTLKKIFFVGTSLLVVFLCIGLLNGTGVQMKDYLGFMQGDVYIESRYPEKDISPISEIVHEEYDAKAIVCDSYSLNALLSSSSSYVNASVQGVQNSFYPLFEKTIGWIVEPEDGFSRGYCVIDIRTATILKVTTGDSITIQYTAEDGFMNTLQLMVAGIYIGNQYLYDNVVFINFEDMHDLILEKSINSVKLYLNEELDDVSLHEISNAYNMAFFVDAFVNSRTDFQETYAYAIFFYYRIFLIVVMSIILFLLVIIMALSMKHIYFMEFRKRRNELATLLAFGMNPSGILLTVFFESLIVFFASLVTAGVFYKIIRFLLSLIHINTLSGQDFVALLGGNSVVIVCTASSVLLFSLLILIIVLVSSINGAKNYLSMHIKDIISSE